MSPDRPRVLVVEDDAQVAHLFTTALTLRGFAATRVADGVSALRVVEKFRPDVVVLDLGLPSLSGTAVLRELAENPLTSDIPVVVCSGLEPLPDVVDAAAVLRKPCDPDEVARIVADLVIIRGR